MAMVTPRALLVTGNTDMTWPPNRSGYISSRAAETVHETFGIEAGLCFTRGYAHCMGPEAPGGVLGAYLDCFPLDQHADTAVRMHPYSELDYDARGVLRFRRPTALSPSLPST